MKKTIYNGPHEGMYKHSKFAKVISDIDELKLAGMYDIPNKSGGSVGKAWSMGELRERARVVYVAEYLSRNSKIMTLFKGSKDFKNVKIEIEACKEDRLTGIEKIINNALHLESK
jgi:hypothetical protein